MTSIFSTYSTGENRVTASFLAVLRAMSLDRMQRLLGSLMEESDFELIQFQNQVAKGGKSVPDAMIQSSIRLLIETKITRNAVKTNQLKEHLERLKQANETTTLLLVLTPDDSRPIEVEKVGDQRVVWASFSRLDQAIDEILEDKYEVMPEREAYLLRELQNMLEAEGLVANPDDVVIVAARRAWPAYNSFHAYICQPDRSFRQVDRLGFYSNGVIYELVPRILERHDRVEMRTGLHKGALGAVVDQVLANDQRKQGKVSKVFILSAPNSRETIKLHSAISNDKKSKTGKPTAFTMGQRYVSSEKLRNAKTTSDLD